MKQKDYGCASAYVKMDHEDTVKSDEVKKIFFALKNEVTLGGRVMAQGG